jgi:hypothetical protein
LRYAKADAQELASHWHAIREQAQDWVLEDGLLLNELVEHFGTETPALGGGSPTEEAAKRYLWLANALYKQKVIPLLVEMLPESIDAGPMVEEFRDAAVRLLIPKSELDKNRE